MRNFHFLALGQALVAVAAPDGLALSIRQQSSSFAGVNSFFLHAFEQQV